MPEKVPLPLLTPSHHKAGLAFLSASAIVGVFVLATVISRHLFESNPDRRRISVPMTAPVASPVSAAPYSDRFRVTAVQGPVECWQNGKAQRLNAGDLLSANDIIRTPPRTRVILDRGGSEVELRENVEIQIEHLEAHTTTLEVLGRSEVLPATALSHDERLVITTDESRAETGGPSRWVVALDEIGKIAFTLEHNQVLSQSGTARVEFGNDWESAARVGQLSSRPVITPQDLWRSVSWPDLNTRRGHSSLPGTTSPSAYLPIDDRPNSADRKSRFPRPASDTRAGQLNEVAARKSPGRDTATRQPIGNPLHAPPIKSSGGDP